MKTMPTKLWQQEPQPSPPQQQQQTAYDPNYSTSDLVNCFTSKV